MDEINKAEQAIENVIVSVADDIMVGINFIVNGVKQVFKAIIKVVEDVVNAIGSFFMQLAKLIEALSVLFHFGEIIWAHNWLKAQFNTLQNNVRAVINNTVKPILAKAIADAEQGVATFFDQFEAALGLNDQVNSVQGSGSTPHSAYTVGGSSHAVQASWGTQNLKSGMASGGGGGGSQSVLLASRAAADDPLTDFFANFWTSITTGRNADDFNQLKTDFNNLFTATSARSFFNELLKTLINAVETLIDAVETLVEVGLTLAGDLLVGVCDFIDQAIDFIVNQVLNFQIEIPVISWLYQLLFNEPLTRC